LRYIVVLVHLLPETMVPSVPINLLSLLILLSFMGSHAAMSSEDGHASCPTTVTASTTIGLSLVQSLSMNRRVDAGSVSESLLEQGAKEGDLGMRNMGFDTTGPRGQRVLDHAPRTVYDSGEAAADLSEEIAHTSVEPLPLEPQLAFQPQHFHDDSSASSKYPDADAIWGALRKVQKRWREGTASLLKSMQHTASRFLSASHSAYSVSASLLSVSSSEASSPIHIATSSHVATSSGIVPHTAASSAASSKHEARATSSGIVILALLLSICLCGVLWKVSRPEPALKFPLSNHPTYHPASAQRLSPIISTTRSPGAASVQVGEPRHLTGARLSSPSTIGAGVVDFSSEDETNIARAEDGHGFCPDLVVPQQCECILVVPVYAPLGNFNICDMNGRTVLQAFTQIEGQGHLWQLHLQTVADRQTLARCIEVRSPSGSVEFRILDAKGMAFATLKQVQGQQRFELTTTQNGFKLYFYGNFQTQAINVTDEDDSLLATTEPCGMDFDQTGIYYRLRVAPLANVGHSLCALLCIGQILRPKPSLP